MGEQSFISIAPHAIYLCHGSLVVAYFLFFFMLIFSNSFGLPGRGTFPAAPVR